MSTNRIDLGSVNFTLALLKTETPAAPLANAALTKAFSGGSDVMATLIVANFDPPLGGRGAVITGPPNHTFGPQAKPGYNPAIDLAGTSPGSDNGQVAANALLRFEQSWGTTGEADQAQFIAQALAQHKNDPAFLQQYIGTLGPERTANALRYLTSLGHVQTPQNYSPGTADPKRLKGQLQDVADALSTLVKNKEFNQRDMDRLVAEFAKEHPENNFSFAKDVLSKASPEVNQMFFSAAKNYALSGKNANSKNGQAMAAYAMQALSQTAHPLSQLERMPKDQLSALVTAAAKGEARYGNPPTTEDFARTGVYRADPGHGAPLDGLSSLMFNAAYSDVGDRFAHAELSTQQAQDLQSQLFQTVTGVLQSDPSVKSFYSQSLGMKNALAAEFQQGYHSIVKAYTGPNGELSSAGMSAFREFSADVLFGAPPASNALGTAQFFQAKLDDFLSSAAKLSPDRRPTAEQAAQAKSLGEQSEALAAGLKQSLAEVLKGSAHANKDTQDVINVFLTVGEAGVGAFGPEAAVGSAVVGEALKLLVSSGEDNSVEKAIQDLKSHGIDVTNYSGGNLQDQSETIQNAALASYFQQGVSNAINVLYF